MCSIYLHRMSTVEKQKETLGVAIDEKQVSNVGDEKVLRFHFRACTT